MVRIAFARLVSLALVVLALTPFTLSAPAQALSTVSVHVTLNSYAGTPTTNGQVSIYRSTGVYMNNYNTDTSGQVTIPVPPGKYYFQFMPFDDGQAWQDQTDVMEISADRSLTLTPASHAVDLDIRTTADDGMDATGGLYCQDGQRTLAGRTASVSFVKESGVTLVDGTATVRVPDVDPGSRKCLLQMTGQDGLLFGRSFDPAATAFSAVIQPGSHLTGSVSNVLGLHNFGGVTVSGGDPARPNTWFEPPGGPFDFFLEPGGWELSFQASSRFGPTTTVGMTDVVTLTGSDLDRTYVGDYRQLNLRVEDSSGAGADATVQVACRAQATSGETWTVAYTRNVIAGSPTTSGSGLDTGSTTSACQISAFSGSNPGVTVGVNATAVGGPNDVTVTLPATFPVTGTVSAAAGWTLDYGVVNAARELEPEHSVSAHLDPSTGEFSIPLSHGSFRLTANGYLTTGGSFWVVTHPIAISPATTVDLAPDALPLTVRIVAEDGSASAGSAQAFCERAGGSDAGVESQLTQDYQQIPAATGTVQVMGLGGLSPSGQASCRVLVRVDDVIVAEHFLSLDPSGPNEIVVLLGTGTVADTSGAPADADGVPDVVEALGPNGGDGNGDGTADFEQSNVTSLPAANGGAGDPYVTVEAPAGATLAAVSTLPVTDVAVTPPPGVTLPGGLIRFRLEDVPPTSTHTVSIYPASTAGLTGYAKFHDGAWTTLPPSRVAIFASRVDITLTDGGIGDDDGVANGTIVDPGGPAIVTSTQPNDLALSAVADVTVNATAHNGAKVMFTKPVVTGSLPSNPSPACSKASGATFPIGTTPVTCTVTDARYANSPVSRSFTVNVLGAAEQLAALRTSVIGVGSGTVLKSAVEKVQAKLAAGNNKTTCKALLEFGVVVAAQLLTKKITVSKAAALAATAVRIGTVLRC